MTDEAAGSVILAVLLVALLGSITISDGDHRLGQSPVFQILLQISVITSIMISPSACTSFVDMLLTPTDLPFFSAAAANSTSLGRIGCRSISWG